jgi:hypothetical protein
MANRLFEKFYYSMTRKLTCLAGSFTMTTQVQAAQTAQSITWTAVAYGTAGNSITIAYTTGGTAGAEVVTVTGSAISVQIESGVSTIDQVVAAVAGSIPAAALITSASSGAGTVAAHAAYAFTGGVNGVVSGWYLPGVSSITQTDVGVVTIVLERKYPAIKSLRFQILSSTAQDLIPQIASIDSGQQTIVVNLLASATKTDPTSDMTVYMKMLIRDSSVTR